MKVNERNIRTKVECLCKKQLIMAPKNVFNGFAWQGSDSRGAKNPLLSCRFKKIKPNVCWETVLVNLVLSQTDKVSSTPITATILPALRLRGYGNLCSLFTFSLCLFQTCLHRGTISHRISQLLETKWDIHTLFFLPVQTQRNSVNKHVFSRPSAMFFSLLISVPQDKLQHIFYRSCFPLAWFVMFNSVHMSWWHKFLK